MASLCPVFLACFLGVPGTAPIDAKLLQVSPGAEEDKALVRSKDQSRAVLLLHGFRPHVNAELLKSLNLPRIGENFLKPLVSDSDSFAKASFQDWQRAGSTLIKHLRNDADVFSFAYGQVEPLEKVVEAPSLAKAVARLKGLGYSEIVLIGHSAGGVVARLFVEDNPCAGVTKVVQVCTPNAGAALASQTALFEKGQEAFLQSLTPAARALSGTKRKEKRIPDGVEFVCVVGTYGKYGDGIVACDSQWHENLQSQGIPMIKVAATHFTVMRFEQPVRRLAEVVRERHPRWDDKRVRDAKATLDFPRASTQEYRAAVEAVASKARDDEKVDALVECAYSLLWVAGTTGEGPVHAKATLEDAAAIVLKSRSRSASLKFLNQSAYLQEILGEDTRETVTEMASGRPRDDVIRAEVVAVRIPVQRIGKDLFDAEVRVRGADKEISEKFGKGIIAAIYPASERHVLKASKYAWPKNGRVDVHVDMEFRDGTSSVTHFARILFQCDQGQKSLVINAIRYEDTTPFPESYQARGLERFQRQFNEKNEPK